MVELNMFMFTFFIGVTSGLIIGMCLPYLRQPISKRIIKLIKRIKEVLRWPERK